jgi:uncharacterized membrane protein
MINFRNLSTKQVYLISFSILLSIIAIIVIGCILYPNIFYDQWIWKYYWGPIVADADPTTAAVIHNGIEAREGYTIVSELTYGFLVIVSLFLIYKLLKKLEISINWIFCLSLMPYIVFGPVVRVLEDTGYFSPPLVYWFISPLIYIQIAFYAILFLLIGYYIEKKWQKKHLTINTILFSGGIALLVPFIILIGQWIAGYQWGNSSGVRFDVFLLILGIISVITLIVYIFPTFTKNQKDISVYQNPLNLSLVVGHMVDGFTSYVSIYDPLNMDLPSYIEKHPASNFLMELWPPLFPIVKFILIISVIYVFDILYKEELKNYKNLVGLIKIGILILGFSPGLRDLLRVIMGV